MRIDISGRIFIGGVLLLISTIAYSSQIFVFYSALGGWSWSTAKVLVPLNILVAMVYYNYYLACTVDPGRVPFDWVSIRGSLVYVRELLFWSNMAFVLLYSIQEPPATISQPSEEAKRMGVTAPRFCKSCNVFKPPRSHHCSSCGRCVLKMDHHCPWINNCVGYDNYGHFLRFVLYVDLATLYVLILLIWRVRTIMDDIRHFRVREDGIIILYVTRAISN